MADYKVSDHMFVHYQVNMPRPSLETHTGSYRKLKQIDNSAFSTDLKDLVSGILSINNINQLVGEYNTELRQLLDRHAFTCIHQRQDYCSEATGAMVL